MKYQIILKINYQVPSLKASVISSFYVFTILSGCNFAKRWLDFLRNRVLFNDIKHLDRS